jgi:GT2 family glycosyltransferase
MAAIAAGAAPAAAESTKRVDVIVPTHARPNLLGRLLRALVPQLARQGACGLIVVNDGTHDERYAAIIADQPAFVDYVALPSPKGPAHARNVGARRSSAEFLAFTDDDCVPPDHWLDWILARLDADPGIDVVAGTTTPPPAGPREGAVERFNRCLGLHPKPLFADGDMYCLPTANVAVRRSLFVQSGGFNEEFRYAAGEDTEFFYRLRFRGARFFVDEDWRTEHPIADSLRAFARRWFRYGYGNAQHRMVSADPFANGLPAGLTPWTILRSLPDHVRTRRSLAATQAGRTGVAWEPSFAALAAVQRGAYLLGGYRAYRSAGYTPGGTADAARMAAARPAHAAAAELLAAATQPAAPPPLFGLVIGAMKCGTSAMFSALRQHPEVAACRLKEPPFFFDEVEFSKGANWYLDLFQFEPGRHRVAVEASPRHTMAPLHRGCAERMRSTGWRFRFVYIVRDPIERIQSHYLHAAAARFGLRPPSAGLDPSVLEVSRYHAQLADYRGLFGRDAILVLRYEDWRSSPQETLRRVCAHLEIGPPASLRAGQVVHSSEFHYRRRLIVEELRRRGLAPAELDLQEVSEAIASLPGAQRDAVEAAVDRLYSLSDAQKTEIRLALKDEMRQLGRDYGIDVAGWGFAP